MSIAGIILAGGKSTRLGRNKALEPLLGKKMVQYVYDCVQPLVEQILIVTSRELATVPYPEGAVVLTDMFSDKGPLSGIYTGLLSAGSDYNIVVGCDMPFLNRKLLRHMVEQCRGFDAVVPKLSPSQTEPLHAIYSRSCVDKMRSLLETGQLQIRSLFKEINVKYIGAQECREFDAELSSFININNQADLEKAIALAGKAGGKGLCPE